MPAAAFRAKCLSLLDEVATNCFARTPSGMPRAEPTVLDTHIWLDVAVGRGCFSPRVRRGIDAAAAAAMLYVAAITPWEIAMLARAGKVRIGEPLLSWRGSIARLPRSAETRPWANEARAGRGPRKGARGRRSSAKGWRLCGTRLSQGRARRSHVRERMTHEGWAALSRPCAANARPRKDDACAGRGSRRGVRGRVTSAKG